MVDVGADVLRGAVLDGAGALDVLEADERLVVELADEVLDDEEVVAVAGFAAAEPGGRQSPALLLLQSWTGAGMAGVLHVLFVPAAS